jgi:UDP-3-O-[3-hydroxymyristoyl] glucosamine N-acyltransferase
VIGAGCEIGDRCVIGPGCYLGPDVRLGADALIEANVTLHRDTRLGERCILHSGTVIGGDGFGFAWDGSGHRKIPQLGRVVIEEDVEIGCNCCVDRATLGETRIRRGTKIDNLVQVAHNTDIGAHVILVSQAGVAGSSKVGSGAIIAGQVAISDHVEVGAGARVGGQSGVTKDVPAGASVFGTPARPIKETLRELAALAQLPALLKRIKTQGQELEALRERLAALERAQ